MKYKAILMDADMTILDFNSAEKHAITKLLTRFGAQDVEAAYERYHQINIECWLAYEKKQLTLDELQVERFRRLCAALLPGADAVEMAIVYEDLLSQQGDLLPRACEVMKAISACLPIAIVTNGTTDTQRKRIKASGIGEYVSHILISEETGSAKPAPDMLIKALNLMGVSPEDALMIGDSLSSDMPAARDAGVDFLWYNPSGRTRPESARITYEARTLDEFVSIARME